MFVAGAIPGDRVRAVVTSASAPTPRRARSRSSSRAPTGSRRSPTTRARRGRCCPTSASSRSRPSRSTTRCAGIGQPRRLRARADRPGRRAVALPQQARVLVRHGRRRRRSCAASTRPGSWERIVADGRLPARLRARQRSARRRRSRGAARRASRRTTAATQRGFLRNLVVREGRRTGQLQVRLVTSPGELDADALRRRPSTPTRLIWTRAAGVGETTRAARPSSLPGAPALDEELCAACASASRPRRSSRPTPRWPSGCTASPVEYAGAAGLGARLRPLLRHRHDRPVAGRRAPARCGASRSSSTPSPTRSPTRGATRSHNARFFAGDVRLALRELVERAGRPDVARRRPAARRPLAEDRPPDHRGRAEADRLRLVQPDDARAERGAARRGGLRAAEGAPGRHVPADAAHRVRRAARTRPVTSRSAFPWFAGGFNHSIRPPCQQALRSRGVARSLSHARDAPLRANLPAGDDSLRAGGSPLT